LARVCCCVGCGAATAATPRRRLAFWLVAGNLTLASVVMTVVSVHLLSAGRRGITLAAAVGLGRCRAEPVGAGGGDGAGAARHIRCGR